MPPYKPAVSRAQERKLFSLAEMGQISKSDAIGKARAAKATGKPLPERVKSSKPMTATSMPRRSMASNLGKFLHPRKSR